MSQAKDRSCESLRGEQMPAFPWQACAMAPGVMLFRLLDCIGLPAACVDIQGRLVHANRFFLEPSGYTWEDVMGVDWITTFVPSEHRQEVLQVHRAAMQALSFQCLTHPVLTRGGDVIVFTWDSIFPYGTLSPEGTVIIGRHVTDLMGAQEAGSKDGEHLRSIFDGTADGITIHGLEGGFLEANAVACRRMGYSHEEFLALSIEDIDLQRHLDLVSPGLELFLKKGQAIFDSEHRSRDGTLVPVEVNARLIQYQGQYAVLSVVRDITERRRMEQTLERSRNSLNNLVDNSSDAILVVNGEGNILYANPSAAMLFHREAPIGLMGEPFGFPIVPGEMTEIEVFSSSAPSRTCEMRVTEIQWHDERAGLVIIRDITERRQIEAERIRAQKLESLGLLAGGIAHDFNNILMGVTGSLSLARLAIAKGVDPSRDIERAEKALSVATELTSQLLTFSKGGRPVRKLTDLVQLIPEAAGFACSGSRSALDIRLQEGLWPAEVDRVQIVQAVSNVVLNAAQSMPEGGTIRIRGENCEVGLDHALFGLPLRAGRYVRVSVEDHGVGIEQENLARVFDPYFTTRPGGSGLGLASTYSIMKNHEGGIDISTQPGRGTVFSLYIPASPLTFSTPEPEEEEPAQRRAAKILVMDDEPLLRELLTHMLRHLGHEAQVASDGWEALRIYEEAVRTGSSFDVVIMDLTIPGGMGGKETIERLLKLDPQAVAIVSSGYSEDSVLQNHASFGFKGLLRKPYRLGDLDRALNEVLRR